ncbi:perlucin-like protein [Ostrea edulis]|uniref:perlucin-like protein n=1 Tax=Ostrea edulis TaxID=37623 RepID=UPI0024AECA81|nr:perlucin-like protein [Ostrea edulis]
MDPSLDNKVSNVSLTAKHHSESLTQCSAICGGLCACFGFHSHLKNCRVHQSCDPSDMTIDETGWRNFFPEGRSCEYDWLEYNSHCYFYGTPRVSWTEARMDCEVRSSQLVEIEDKEESAWLAATFLLKDSCASNIYEDCTAWTGGNDIFVEGDYRWHHSNSTMNFTNWYAYQPSVNFAGRNEDCVDILRDARWNDGECHIQKSYICEKNL